MTPSDEEEYRHEAVPSIIACFYPGVPREKFLELIPAIMPDAAHRRPTVEEINALAASLRVCLPGNPVACTHG